MGELKPLVSPLGFHAPGQEKLFFPNDDGKGQIMVHNLREGNLLHVMRTAGVKIADVQAKNSRSRASGFAFGGGSSGSNISRLTSGGRINAMAWRHSARSGEGLEMYSAHGDGRICCWLPSYSDDNEDDEEINHRRERAMDHGVGNDDVIWLNGETSIQAGDDDTAVLVLDDAEHRRKRKRDMLEDMLGGLSRQSMRLS
jgi:hypothetical protein